MRVSSSLLARWQLGAGRPAPPRCAHPTEQPHRSRQTPDRSTDPRTTRCPCSGRSAGGAPRQGGRADGQCDVVPPLPRLPGQVREGGAALRRRHLPQVLRCGRLAPAARLLAGSGARHSQQRRLPQAPWRGSASWIAERSAEPPAAPSRRRPRPCQPVQSLVLTNIHNQPTPVGNSNESTKALFKDRLKCRTTPSFFVFRHGG